MRNKMKLLLMSLFIIINNGCTETVSIEKIEERFSYVPPSVEEGKVKAIIEIGSSGFNLFVVSIDKDKNWKLEKAEWGKKSEIYESNASIEKIESGIEDYLEAVKAYNTEEIYFLISSGAAKAKTTQDIVKVLKSKHSNVKVATAVEEAKYGFSAAIPKEFQKDSFLIDVGSGNSKFAWMENNELKTLEGYGSKAYKLSIDKAKVYENIKNLSENIPKNVRKRAFFIGGIAYKFAKKNRIDKEDYTTLPSAMTLKKDSFSKEKMQYGLEIYRAINDATGTRQYIFPWNANFSIGYLLSLPY